MARLIGGFNYKNAPFSLISSFWRVDLWVLCRKCPSVLDLHRRKKLCGKVLILSFSVRDGCIGWKPKGEKNDEMHNSQRLFMIFSPFFTRFGREMPAKKPQRTVFRSFLPSKSRAKPPFLQRICKGCRFCEGNVRRGRESGEKGVFRRFSVRIVPGSVHASATSPTGRVCSAVDDEGELGKKSACFTQ